MVWTAHLSIAFSSNRDCRAATQLRPALGNSVHSTEVASNLPPSKNWAERKTEKKGEI